MSAAGDRHVTAPPFRDESLVAAGPDAVAAVLAGEVVILSIRDGIYYQLEGVGALVWERLATPVRVDALVTAIVERFEVEPKRAREDLVALLADLEAAALVVRIPAPTP